MSERSMLIGRVHAARRRLGLDDAAYREMLHRITGKSSSAELNLSELQAVLDVIGPRGRSQALHPHGKKVQALWLSGWNLGLVRDRSEAAMRSFIKRQTGIDHHRWLIDARDATRVIEGLKAWLARDGEVAWWAWDDPARAVIDAQWRRLGDLGALPDDDIDAYAMTLSGRDTVRATTQDLILIQRALGRRLRGALARERKREEADARQLH